LDPITHDSVELGLSGKPDNFLAGLIAFFQSINNIVDRNGNNLFHLSFPTAIYYSKKKNLNDFLDDSKFQCFEKSIFKIVT
jgi:hypothetical protein